MSQVDVALKGRYQDEVRAKMQERHNYKNVMAVPKLEKIVINIGLGEARDDSKVIERAPRASFHRSLCNARS